MHPTSGEQVTVRRFCESDKAQGPVRTRGALTVPTLSAAAPEGQSRVAVWPPGRGHWGAASRQSGHLAAGSVWEPSWLGWDCQIKSRTFS